MLVKTLRKVATMTLRYLVLIRKGMYKGSIRLIGPKKVSDVIYLWKSNIQWVLSQFSVRVKVKVSTMCLCRLPGSASGFCVFQGDIFLSWFWANPLPLEASLSSRGVRLVKVTHCFCTKSFQLLLVGSHTSTGKWEITECVLQLHFSVLLPVCFTQKHLLFSSSSECFIFWERKVLLMFHFSLLELIRKETKHDFRLFPLMNVLFLVQKSKLKDFSTVPWIISPNQATLFPFFLLIHSSSLLKYLFTQHSSTYPFVCPSIHPFFCLPRELVSVIIQLIVFIHCWNNL